jgi:hypothetical protein
MTKTLILLTLVFAVSATAARASAPSPLYIPRIPIIIDPIIIIERKK